MSNYPLNDYRDYLEHSAKGKTWSDHKYLYITSGGRYVYPEGASRSTSKTRKKRSTVRLASSRTDTFADHLESVLYNTIKKSAKKLTEERSHPVERKHPTKRSIFARYLGQRRFGGRTSTKNGRRGSYSSRCRKF